MKKLFLTVIFFALFTSLSNLHARDNWQSAYVIVNESDTLFGQVDFRRARDNQRQCIFRKDENSEVIIFSPNDILGYRFTPDGKFFISKTIEVGGVSTKTFVEFMAKGMMNLYHYVDENRRSHYLLESENDRSFLITRERERGFLLTNTKSGQVMYGTNFDEMIRIGFQDFHPIVNHLENFRFNRRSMLNLATAYHNLVCPLGEKNIVFENVDRIQTQITVYTAFKQYVFGLDARGIQTTHFYPAVAVGAEAVFMYPQFSKNIGFYTDLSVAQLLNNELNIERPNALGGTGNYYRKINFDITTRVGVKYIYPMRKFTPRAKLGVSLQCLVGEAQFNGIFDKLLVSPGVNIGLGAEHSLKNGNALSFYFQFDRYGAIERGSLWRHPTLTLSVYRLRLGYTF